MTREHVRAVPRRAESGTPTLAGPAMMHVAGLCLGPRKAERNSKICPHATSSARASLWEGDLKHMAAEVLKLLA